MRGFTEFTPYQYLPSFAKMAIERLDADSELRAGDMLDELLIAYASSYRMALDPLTRESAHHICARRFWNFRPRAADAAAHALALLLELANYLTRSYPADQFDGATAALLVRAAAASAERSPDVPGVLRELADYLTRNYPADQFDGATLSLLEQACVLSCLPFRFASAA